MDNDIPVALHFYTECGTFGLQKSESFDIEIIRAERAIGKCLGIEGLPALHRTDHIVTGCCRSDNGTSSKTSPSHYTGTDSSSDHEQDQDQDQYIFLRNHTVLLRAHRLLLGF